MQRFFTLAFAVAILGGCASGGASSDGGQARHDGGQPGIDGGPDLCGNGAVDPGEECDSSDLGGQSCTGLGYASGNLGCLADCTFDKGACVAAVCGNGSIDSGEDCDGTDLGGATCESRGFVGGTLACTGDCTFDTSDCSTCGNGSVDGGEECDGANLGGATCASRGHTSGTLSCDGSCGIDESACVDASCGDGARAGSEDCDGADLGGATCADVGFFAGALACNSDCTFQISGCHNCGDGSIQGIEQCDGADLGGASCTTRGFTMGTLACSSGCTYDTSGCSSAACGNGVLESGELCDDGNATTGDGCTSCAVDSGFTCVGTPSSCSAICGDGMIRGGEECDGASLGGASCTSRGFTGGTLTCSSCRFNESACTTTSCGNSTIEPSAGEECDDGNTVSFDGCDSSCHVDANYYLPVRLRNGEGSNHGMLEVYFSGAWREVCDDTYTTEGQQAMADVVCRQLGYTGTGHQFINAFGGGTGSPAMDDVYCTGSEPNLSQCTFGGWNLHNCSGSEAVGIRCMPGEGDIRLVGGPHGMEGRLQIYHSGAWGEVCDDYFDGAYTAYYGYSTTTVCQQLGYRGGSFLSTYDTASDTFVLDDVNCTGTERRIGDCPHQPYGTENCFTTEPAGFRCDIYADGDSRLIGGSARNSGRVEVLHGPVWGTICDDWISTADTRQSNFITVGCRQLGFSGAGSALLDTSVPDGTDPTWMDDMSCAGTEARLSGCTFAGWGIENCSHYEDIGLSCTP